MCLVYTADQQSGDAGIASKDENAAYVAERQEKGPIQNGGQPRDP